MSDSERLIKQTYSVHVSLPEDRAQGITRKWHISEFSVKTILIACLNSIYTAAYFSQQKLDSLATVDTIRGVGDVHVPEGIFRSGRTGGRARGRDGDSTRTSGGHGFSPVGDNSTGIQAPPSFSAFHSTPPDAAIRKLHWYHCNTASLMAPYRIFTPDAWQLPSFPITNHEYQSCFWWTPASFSAS